MTIELTDEDFSFLLLVLGYATGKAAAEGNEEMVTSLMQLANRINKDNPTWRPYTFRLKPLRRMEETE